MALVSGIAWAYGSLRIYSRPHIKVYETVFAFFAGGMLVTAAVTILPIAGNEIVPTWSVLESAWPWLALLIALFGVPPVVMVLWGASCLSPGRVGILLMGEVLVGVTSAAAWSGEPFGLREVVGTVLIAGAAVIETVHPRPDIASG